MRERLIGARDVAWMLALMALGLGPRLYWASGFGLGDDMIFRGEVASVLLSKSVLPDNQAYRFSWWFPTALSCRIFGLTEFGLILPFTIASVLGIGLLYVVGKALWGRPGGVIAALLLVAIPIDFVWSTMMANDIILSVLMAATVLLALRALEQEDPKWKRRLWTGAGFCFWLAFHAKLSGVFLLPIVGAVVLGHRRQMDRSVLCFVVTAGSLVAASSLFLYVFTGDPLFHYHSELSFQGLSGPLAIARRITPDVLWYYPQLLFRHDSLGDLLYSVYPHVLIVLALVGLGLGIRSSGVVFWWLAVVFLGMEFNLQRVSGVWISGFRNIRHVHVFVYPMILLMTGYLVGLWARWPRTSAVLLAGLLVFSGWQCVATASKTHIAFGDRRTVCRFLLGLPPKPMFADQGIGTWCCVLDPVNGPPKVAELPPDPASRKTRIAGITRGYLVTGGAREPYYGCPSCITRAAELPAGRWRLVREFPDPVPPVPWREETMRVWEAVEAPG